jgi:hypothetical protein
MRCRRKLVTPIVLAPVVAITVSLTGCGGGTERPAAAAPDDAARLAAAREPVSAEAGGQAAGQSSSPSPSPSSGSVSTASQSTPKQPAGPAGWRLCTNNQDRYSIQYPAGWFTTHLKKDPPCQMFDPQRFQITRGSEYPHTALMVWRHQNSMDQEVRQIMDSSTEEWKPLTGAYVTIRGMRAFRFEEITTNGELEFDKGTRRYGYVLDQRDRALVVSTLASPTQRTYEADKGLVDKAVRTLRLY